MHMWPARLSKHKQTEKLRLPSAQMQHEVILYSGHHHCTIALYSKLHATAVLMLNILFIYPLKEVCLSASKYLVCHVWRLKPKYLACWTDIKQYKELSEVLIMWCSERSTA